MEPTTICVKATFQSIMNVPETDCSDLRPSNVMAVFPYISKLPPIRLSSGRVRVKSTALLSNATSPPTYVSTGMFMRVSAMFELPMEFQISRLP